MRCCVYLLLAAIAAPANDFAAAAGPSVTIGSLELGFDGLFKVGHFIPARVRIQNSDRPRTIQADLLVPDDQGVPCRFHSVEHRFEANESRDVQLYVKIGRLRGTALVACSGVEREFYFGADGGESVGRSIAATDELIITLGAAAGVDDALKLGASELAWQAHSIQIENPAELPDESRGFDGVDAVVISTADAALFDAPLQAKPQREALNRWLRLGGRVLVCGARRAPEIFDADAPQLVSLPAELAEMVPLRNTSSIEAYADTNAPIDVSPLTERLMMPRLENVAGVVEAWAGNRTGELPLVIRAPYGFGELTYVALDLDRPPMSHWAGRPRFINRLLGRRIQRLAESQRGNVGSVKTVGYNEMSGQLRAALDQFDEVPFVSFWVVAVLVGLYAVAVGPLDYWLVRRVLGRPNATWITFAFWGLLFAGIGMFATSRLKGNDARLRQVELIDYDLSPSASSVPEEGQGLVAVRSHVWLNFFAPRAEAYTFTIQQTLPGSGRNDRFTSASLSWHGLPGPGLGGMQTSDTSQAEWPYAYDAVVQPVRLAGMPMYTWSTRALAARGATIAPVPIHFELAAAQDGLLAGVLANRLGVDMSDATLFYDRWAYQIGDFAAGQEIDIQSRLKPLDARALLTRQQNVGDADRAQRYEPQSTEIARIVEVQMFHDQVGGSAYTQLNNRSQQSIDLSHLIRDGRAILIAQLDGPVSRLDCSPLEIAPKQYQATTFVRFVLPVAPK